MLRDPQLQLGNGPFRAFLALLLTGIGTICEPSRALPPSRFRVPLDRCEAIVCEHRSRAAGVAYRLSQSRAAHFERFLWNDSERRGGSEAAPVRREDATAALVASDQVNSDAIEQGVGQASEDGVSLPGFDAEPLGTVGSTSGGADGSAADQAQHAQPGSAFRSDTAFFGRHDGRDAIPAGGDGAGAAPQICLRWSALGSSCVREVVAYHRLRPSMPIGMARKVCTACRISSAVSAHPRRVAERRGFAPDQGPVSAPGDKIEGCRDGGPVFLRFAGRDRRAPQEGERGKVMIVLTAASFESGTQMRLAGLCAHYGGWGGIPSLSRAVGTSIGELDHLINGIVAEPTGLECGIGQRRRCAGLRSPGHGPGGQRRTCHPGCHPRRPGVDARGAAWA